MREHRALENYLFLKVWYYQLNKSTECLIFKGECALLVLISMLCYLFCLSESTFILFLSLCKFCKGPTVIVQLVNLIKIVLSKCDLLI